MKEHICKNCGKKFMAYESDHRLYCSHKCSVTKSWERRERKTYETRICAYCGNKIKIKSKDYRLKHQSNFYCNKTCSDLSKKTGSIIKCLYCEKEFYSTRKKFCSKECVYKYRIKNNSHKLYIEGQYWAGYEKGYNKKGNYKLHRKIMEEHLGRKLNLNEIVHHIDGNKLNNNIENLKVMTRGEHSRYHRLEEIKEGKKLFTKKEV